MSTFMSGVIILIALAIAHPANAGVCDDLSSPRTILLCALERHPNIQVGRAGVEAADALEPVAKQRPNPEVNSQTVWAKTYGKPYFYTEYNFAHTFELGGKRSARIERARAELQKEKANTLEIRENVYIETLINLFRLRQLKAEMETVNDALMTFGRIRKQYKSRPRLNPEQQANLRLFELAEADYRMRLIPLEAEVHHHLKTLEIALGKSLIPEGAALPIYRKDWPELPDSIMEDLSGSRIKLAMADLKVSTTELSLAKSTAWPDFKIGPTYELQNSIGQNFDAYGFNFVIPLPLYHRNEAGRAYANLEIKRNELKLEAEKKMSFEERTHYRLRYQRAVGTLESAYTEEDLRKRHTEVERLFDQGLIPGNLVIELHRQIHDFTKTFNTQELEAAESLVRVYMLDGKIPEEMVW